MSTMAQCQWPHMQPFGLSSLGQPPGGPDGDDPTKNAGEQLPRNHYTQADDKAAEQASQKNFHPGARFLATFKEAGVNSCYTLCLTCGKPAGKKHRRKWRECTGTCPICGVVHLCPCPQLLQHANEGWWMKHAGQPMTKELAIVKSTKDLHRSQQSKQEPYRDPGTAHLADLPASPPSRGQNSFSSDTRNQERAYSHGYDPPLDTGPRRRSGYHDRSSCSPHRESYDFRNATLPGHRFQANRLPTDEQTGNPEFSVPNWNVQDAVYFVMGHVQGMLDPRLDSIEQRAETIEQRLQAIEQQRQGIYDVLTQLVRIFSPEQAQAPSSRPQPLAPAELSSPPAEHSPMPSSVVPTEPWTKGPMASISMLSDPRLRTGSVGNRPPAQMAPQAIMLGSSVRECNAGSTPSEAPPSGTAAHCVGDRNTSLMPGGVPPDSTQSLRPLSTVLNPISRGIRRGMEEVDAAAYTEGREGKRVKRE